uniref:Uncharacterized protein n=1 Tax=Opuntia streptacantha TaxID=393608 RepID=A0A7C9CXN1_OPUST
MKAAFSRRTPRPKSSSRRPSMLNSFLHLRVLFIMVKASFTLKSLARRNFHRMVSVLSSLRRGTPHRDTSSGGEKPSGVAFSPDGSSVFVFPSSSCLGGQDKVAAPAAECSAF